jgi:hypothetical protein
MTNSDAPLDKTKMPNSIISGDPVDRVVAVHTVYRYDRVGYVCQAEGTYHCRILPVRKRNKLLLERITDSPE